MSIECADERLLGVLAVKPALSVAALDATRADQCGRFRVDNVLNSLHAMLCHWNHTDGCSWDYEDWDKPGHARMWYLELAETLKANGVNKTVVDTIRKYNDAKKLGE